MKPKSILDPQFRYVSSANTNIRKTFARVRRDQRREQVERAADAAAGVRLVMLSPRLTPRKVK